MLIIWKCLRFQNQFIVALFHSLHMRLRAVEGEKIHLPPSYAHIRVRKKFSIEVMTRDRVRDTHNAIFRRI